MTESEALELAKSAAGGASGLATRLKGSSPDAKGISPQAVSQWRRAPSGRVLAIEAATGVSRHDLRPDIYPREHAQASAEATR